MAHTNSLPKNVRALEALVRRNGLGETLRRPAVLRHPPVPSGIRHLDRRLGGGLPRGSISEITGSGSSGRTGLVLGVLARSTREGEIAAYVDASDSLDPRSAEESGIVLERLLWVRCGGPGPARRGPGSPPADSAWRAVSLVAAAGAFGVVVADLGGLSLGQLDRWQRHPWMRLKHALEGASTALLVLGERHVAGSSAGLVLELCRTETEWDGLLSGIGLRARVVRNRLQGRAAGAGGRSA